MRDVVIPITYCVCVFTSALRFVRIITMKMFNPFQTKPDVKEEVKNTKRSVDRAQREIGRDANELEREEKLRLIKLKDAAKRQNQAEMKILAKQIVQIRKQREKISSMGARMGTIKTQAVVMGAQHAMGQTMAQTTKTMRAINKSMNAEKVHESMIQFQTQANQMGVTEEMMEDMMDSFEENGTEEEADAMTAQVLEELGVQATAGLQSAPSGKVKGGRAQQANAAQEEEDAADEEEVEKLMRTMLKG